MVSMNPEAWDKDLEDDGLGLEEICFGRKSIFCFVCDGDNREKQSEKAIHYDIKVSHQNEKRMNFLIADNLERECMDPKEDN